MIAEVLQNKVSERGITKAELARRASVNPDLLAKSLRGKREFRAGEFVSICHELGLTLEDFERQPQQVSS